MLHNLVIKLSDCFFSHPGLVNMLGKSTAPAPIMPDASIERLIKVTSLYDDLPISSSSSVSYFSYLSVAFF